MEDFEINGETFHVKTVRPEVISAWDASPATTDEEAYARLDNMILSFIDDGNGQAEKWRALRASDENAIAVGQMRGLIRWLVESQSDFPTEQPASSRRGRGKTATPSEAESS
jgi:hypothetical protein